MKKEDVIFVLFGVTGDLAKRKLLPSIYRLIENQKIEEFHIIGIGRKPVTEKELIESSKKFLKNPDKKILQKMENSMTYLQINFYRNGDYNQLKDVIDRLEKGGIHNRIFYLATASENFPVISENVSRIGVCTTKKGWSRVVFEKPFGHDLESAKKLNKDITKIFNENQIYRIDHYLGKDLVGNISLSRFTNRILEPLWNSEHIESMQIILDEKIDIENRGGYYDKHGAVKDVIQNHGMQLLALLTMDPPKELRAKDIRNEKAEILESVKVEDYILGQYKGYKKEEGVEKGSNTETFAAIKFSINNKVWKDTDFFMKTGKALDKKETKVAIKFRQAECKLADFCGAKPNYMEIVIAPEDQEGISFDINTKLPGKNEVTQVKTDFCHSCLFGPNTPEAYENLFTDIIAGDQSVFVREDEIEKSWKIIEGIKKKKPHPYKKGSKGPKELEKFNKKHKIEWKQK